MRISYTNIALVKLFRCETHNPSYSRHQALQEHKIPNHCQLTAQWAPTKRHEGKKLKTPKDCRQSDQRCDKTRQWVQQPIHTSYFTIPTRIGEADHPGPKEHETFAVGFVNPTTVLNRENALCALNVDLLAMAETSATKITQNQVRKNMKTRGYTTLWSLPVDSHREMLNGQESYRGVASGVAIASRLPVRPYRDPQPTEILTSSRLTFAYVQFGATTILVGSFYGLASGNDMAQQQTNNLLEYAAETMLAHPGPTMILGDFNHDLHSLPAIEKLTQAGYVSILDLHQQIYGQKMPHTYQESTTRDLMIFSTELAAAVVKIQILKDTEFPNHAPVIAHLQLPQGGLSKKIWQTPKNWMELGPNSELQSLAYDQLEPIQLSNDFEANLQMWNEKVEQTMDMAIHMQHQLNPDEQPHTKLPKAYRGRANQRKPTTQRFRTFVPRARIGDYEPDFEIRSFKTTQIVRQLRRIQSLRRRVQKLATYDQVWQRTWDGLQTEWRAIIKAKGFGEPFHHWICNALQWPFVTMTLPQMEILQAIEEAVQNYLKQKSQEDQKLRQENRWINQQIDHLYNYDRKAYASIREPPLQFIQSLTTNWQVTAIVDQIRENSLDLTQIVGNIPTIGAICRIDNHQAVVSEFGENHFQIHWIHSPPNLVVGQLLTFQIESRGMQPSDIHRALDNYWQPIWNRDTTAESTDVHQWEEFGTILDQLDLPQINSAIDTTSLELWQQVLAQTNSQSAPGADGWHYSELKALPTKALQELIEVFNHPSFQGFPETLMLARVVPLPKKEETDTANNTRPITVLPTLYRLWSAVAAHQIMKQATGVLPDGMIGFVKGKSGFQGMYSLAWQIELAHHSHEPLSGLTLDLTKAFNQFPRIPVMMILKKMGIPPNILHQWLASLNQMQKVFDHRGWISNPAKSTTGIVEGDGLSIVGMIGIATFWMKMIEHSNIKAMAYADNLSWSSSDSSSHEYALNRTIQCFRMLRIPIDWNKTWVWGTHKTHRAMWKNIATNCLPPDQELQILHSSVDLGIVMNYSATNRLLKIADRLQSAIQRLQRLARQNYPIDVVAKLIATAVLPKAFYGQEISLLGKKHFQDIRVHAARALLGKHNAGVASLANMLASDSLEDPELYVIQNAVRASKKLLSSLSSDQRQQFYKLAAQAKGTCASTKGPASALKGYLERLGIGFSPTGTLMLLSGINVSLFDTPFPTIKKLLQEEWMRDLPILTTERKAILHAPKISRRLTRQVIKVFSVGEQRRLLQDICGTFQMQDQKAHWTGEDTDQCPFCVMKDNRKHRATSCPALQDVYDNHNHILDQMTDLNDIHFDLPVIYQSPYHDLFQQCNYLISPVEFTEASLDIVDNQLASGHIPTFFTDGSCFAPAQPEMAMAAWAIIVSNTVNPDPNEVTECLGTSLKNLSSMFTTAAVSRSHGEQTVDRAELQSILHICERWKRTRVITDSSYAQQMIAYVYNTKSKAELMMKPNSDILTRLYDALEGSEHQIIKVESHVLEGRIPKQQHDPFFLLGNYAADQAAKRANQQLAADMMQQWSEEHGQVLQEQKRLKGFFKLLLDVQEHRALLENNHKASRAQQMVLPTYHPKNKTRPQQLAEWAPEETRQYQLYWSHDIRLNGPWGEELLSAVIQWWNQLQWPIANNTNIQSSGITWGELLLDFLLDRRMNIPSRHPNSTSKKMETSLYALKHAGVAFFHIIKNFYWMIAWLNKRLKGTMLQDLKVGSVTSLQRQGSTNRHHGIKARPILTHQVEAVAAINTYRCTFPRRFTGLVAWPWNDVFWSSLHTGE